MWKASIFFPSLPELKYDLKQHSTLLIILSVTLIERQTPTKRTFQTGSMILELYFQMVQLWEQICCADYL